jgi:hypothetical protein
MILSSTSHWTYRCPLAPLSAVRWTVGIFSAALWARVGFADLTHETTLWTLLAAIITTQFFGTLSSAMLMLRPRVGLLRRVTDWYAIVTSVMTWVIGVGALVSGGISFLHLALLLAAVAIGVMWLVLIYFGLRPIRLGAIERE